MKAKDFLVFDFSPWSSSFSEDIYPGLDCLTLSSDYSDTQVNIRDDDNCICVEWVTEDDADQIFSVFPDSPKSINEVYSEIKEYLDSI